MSPSVLVASRSSFRDDDRGASLVEYVLAIGMVSVVALGAAKTFGAEVRAKVSAQADCLETLTCGRGALASPASRPAAKTSPSEKEHHHRPWYSHPVGVLKGFGLGAYETGRGLVELGVHRTILMAESPYDPFGIMPWSPTGRDNLRMASGLFQVARHPVRTYDALKTSLGEAWRKDPDALVGRGAFQVALAFTPAKLAQVRDLAALGDAAELVEGERALQAVDAEAALARSGALGDASRVASEAATEAVGKPLLRERLRALFTKAKQEPAFGWRDVNGFPGEAGKTINCTRCVVAVDATLDGAPASALPLRGADGLPTDDLIEGMASNPNATPAGVATQLGRDAAEWEFFDEASNAPLADPKQLAVDAVKQWGPGSKGIVSVHGTGVGHVFNVINDGGDVMFLDGQIGALGDAAFEPGTTREVGLLRTKNWDVPLPPPGPP